MRLIRRSSRRFSPRQVEYTYPELRNSRSPVKRGILNRPDGGSAAESNTRSGGSRR